MTMKILYLIPTLSVADGLSVSLSSVVTGAAKTYWRPSLLCGAYDDIPLRDDVIRDLGADAHVLRVWQPIRGRRWQAVSYPPGFLRVLRVLSMQSDVVHVFGLWRYPSLVGTELLR